MDNLLYQLEKELEYSYKGDFAKTATIELGPPSYDCFKQATKLTQFVTAAALNSARYKGLAEGKKDDGKADEEEIDVEAVKFLLMSGKEDFDEIHSCFRALACKVGKVSEDTKLKPNHFSKMSYKDNVYIMCEYVANFIMPSLF